MSNPPPFRNPTNAPDKSVFLFPLSILPKKKHTKENSRRREIEEGLGGRAQRAITSI